MTAPHLPWRNPERVEKLQTAMDDRILILDGAMGTMLQGHKLDEAGYRGKRFAGGCDSRHPHPHADGDGCEHDLKGDNDLLSLTQPGIITDIHRAYLEAGADLVETNTFNATRLSQSDYKLEHLVPELNEQGAKLARVACDAAEQTDPSRPRFAIGVLGPTSRTASLSPDVNDPGFRNVDFRELADNYGEAAEALIQGGADLLMVETIFDTLNAKAALFAIDEVFERLQARVPIMISGTITDKSGRTLSGQTAEAFYYSVRHANPLTVGLNCALGAEDLRPYVQSLSDIAGCRISTHPNAGLPNELAEYDQTPEEMATIVGSFAQNGWVNIVGGCCGTTPDHIQAIAAAVAAHAPRRLPDRAAAA